MTPTDYEYDVAISFLVPDEPLAREIAGKLEPALKVFVYSKAQEKVAGADGVETFREVFRHRSRVSLVLYRQGWGQTPWTAVEEIAIRDYCLETRFERLVFVVLDRNGSIPKWVPDSYIYLDLTRFTLDDLTGIVKGKAAQFGAELRAPTPAQRARTIAAREAFDAETKQLLRETPKPFHETADALHAALDTHCADMERETGWKIVRGGDSHHYFVVFTGGVTAQLLPQEVYANSAHDGFLHLRLFDGRMLTPEERRQGMHVWGEPQQIGGLRLTIGREPNIGWCWKYDDRTLTIEAAAELVLDELLKAREQVQGRRR